MIGSLLGTTGRLGTTRRVVAALLGLLVLAAVVVAALLVDDSTPRPRPASAPASEFSAERAMTQLRHFATRPHPIGSAASDTTRNYLQARLRAAGLRVHTGRGVGHAEFPGGAVLGRVANIVATLPGRDPTGSVIIAAHYDSVADGPGAADDGSSVASMLETVRALRSGGPLRNDVVLLITDGEEPGLLGSSAFVRDDPLARRRGVVLNWEARGTSGPSLMFETSRNNAKLIDIFAEGAPHPHGDSSLVELYRLLPNDTDFSNLRTRLPGLNSAFIGDVRFYHTAQDSVANLDRGTLQQHGANMLGLSRAFGDTDLSTLASDHDETYFRFLGLLVHYSDVVTYLLAVLAVLAVLAFAALARRRRIASMPRMLLGAGSVLLPLVVAAALAQGLWWLVSTVRPEFSDALYRDLAFQLAVLALVVLAVATWYGLLRKRIGPAALAVGGLGFLAVLGALCVVALPGMSFLFAVPALTGALGGLLALLVPGRVSALPVAVLGAAPAMVLLVPFGLLTLSGFGFEMGGAGAAAAVLVLSGLPLLAIVELALPVDEGSAWRVSAVPLAALLAVVLLTAGGLAVDQYDTRHPRRSALSYVLRTDTGRASWVSTDHDPDSWAHGYANGPATERPPEPFDDGQPLWTGVAPRISEPAPRVDVGSASDGVRRLHVSSSRGATAVTVLFGALPSELTVRADGYRPNVLDPKATTGRWPYRLSFVDLPASGVDIEAKVAAGTRFAVFDQTVGLAQVPGFRPRPAGVDTAAGQDSTLLVGRNVNS